MGHLQVPSIDPSVQVNASLRLDRIDIKILVALQEDGRMTNLKLADAVGLSATPCLQRVRRLEAKGYIQAYGAVLNIRRLGTHITVLTELVLRSRQREDTQPFERYIHRMPLIMECFAVTGEHDYLIKSVARDVGHYQEMMEELQAKFPSLVRYSSVIVLRSVKQERAFPLELFQNNAEADPGQISTPERRQTDRYRHGIVQLNLKTTDKKSQEGEWACERPYA